MKENEFDIYVRDLMSGAEEPVSPEVWKGVSAGLDKAVRGRVVPAWLWRSMAGAGMAAAIAAAFVLLRPEKNLSNQPIIQNPVAQVADAPLPSQDETEGEDVVPVTEQVSRLEKRMAHIPALPVVEAPAAQPAVIPDETADGLDARKPDAVITPVPQQETFTSDEDVFNKLAFEEHKTRRRGRFSVGATGHLQSNTRPDSPVSTIRRTSGLFVMPTPSQTGLYDERPEFSFGIPMSAGIGLRYDFNQRWGIGTGLVYTHLSRSFIANYAEVAADQTITKHIFDTDVSNQQHYLGVPVQVFFNVVNNGNWNFHVRLDGMGEKLLDNHFVVHDGEGDINFHEQTKNLQFSAGVGVGVEFKFSPYVGLYVDPTIRYYFDCGQPRSLRTIQPLRLDFEAGLRITLGQ